MNIINITPKQYPNTYCKYKYGIRKIRCKYDWTNSRWIQYSVKYEYNIS